MSAETSLLVSPDNPALRQIASPVEDLSSPDFKNLLRDMLLVLKNRRALGIAAPQLGESKRVFLMDSFRGAVVVVNPQILESSTDYETVEELCLSLPGQSYEVSRPDAITVRYLDQNHIRHKKTFRGMMARVFQHENDHLNGILISDK